MLAEMLQANDEGLRQYNVAFDELMRKSDEGGDLVRLNTERWQILVRRGFGIEMRDEDHLSVAKARQLASMLSLKMQDEAFLTKIDEQIVLLAL